MTATEKTRKKVWIIIFLIAVLCCVGCLVALIVSRWGYEDLEKLRSDVKVSSEVVSSKAPVSVETPVDFEELQRANPDIYAWINVPGTVIDYPILQHPENNAFYLNHTVNGNSSRYGSIYTESYNKKDFSDFNTVIYGHNMLNGTMFGTLKRFRNRDFFKENRVIHIYMPGRIMKYEIFAAYIWNDSHILLSYDFVDPVLRKGYLDMIFNTRNMSANIADDVPVTINDKIITLSTCTSKDNERYLVQAVRTYDSYEQE